MDQDGNPPHIFGLFREESYGAVSVISLKEQWDKDSLVRLCLIKRILVLITRTCQGRPKSSGKVGQRCARASPFSV